MKFLGLDLPMPHRSQVYAERTSKYISHQSKREKARRLKQLAEANARLVAKLESRG